MSDDIAETVETERYREILEMKKRVVDTKDEIDRARVSGRIAEGRAIELYQRKVRDYVLSVETLLDPADSEPSPYWREYPVGSFELPNGEQKRVVGLAEFVELSASFEVEVERKQQRSYRHKAETRVETIRARPPERLIEQAFRMTDKAMDELGFDLDRPTKQDETEFNKIDDVDKATRIFDFIQSLGDDDLREAKREIDNVIKSRQNATNGHHE